MTSNPLPRVPGVPPALVAVVARALGSVPTVGPRPRSRFEDDPPGDLAVVEDERVAPAPGQAAGPPLTRPTTPDRPVAPSQPRPQASAQAADVPVTTEATTSPQIATPAAAAEPEPGGPSPRGRDRARRPAAPPAPATDPVALERGTTTPPAPAPTPARPSGAVTGAEQPSDRSTARPRQPTAPPPAPARPVTAMVTRQEPAAPRQPGTEAVQPRGAAAPDPAPVEVRIGRLVVDARPAPPAQLSGRAARERSRRRAPGPDLEAYLREGP